MNQYLKKSIHTALFASLCTLAAAPTAWSAESSVDIGTVKATAASKSAKKGTAAAVAPSRTPLNVSQPTSVVSQKYIRDNTVPTANYDEQVNHTPSVVSIAPNGPGLMENMGFYMRGFADGQFNVTFDGMPWGDSNDFTHHTTSYWMAHDLTQATVDRGPGTAATVGEATFGGTIALHSRNPSAKASINPYGMVGSWNTQLYGMEFDTGTLPNYHGASEMFDYEKMRSDGYLTNSGIKRKSMFLKVAIPVSDNTTVTISGMYNQLHQYVPAPKTAAQIALHGWNWGLSNDPTQENYKGYNYDKIHTDFEYIDLQSYLGNDWNLDNKLYTFGYYHHGWNGNDPTGNSVGGFTSTTYPGLVTATTPTGQRMEMNYRSVGDFFRLAKDINIGTINAGVWYEHQYNDRFETNVDMALAGNPTLASLGVATPAWNRLMHDTFDNVQPYVELAWKPTSNLTVTPGVKYAWFQRHLNAQVNQSPSGAPLVFTKSWSKVLPALDVHYKIQPGWVAYLQVAEGFLAPNLNVFYVNNPSASNFKPESTWNYQIGTTWQNDRVTLSADAYYIDFNNYLNKIAINGNPVNGYKYVNSGGTTFSGFEAEGTVLVGDGFSVYANGSYNSAKAKGANGSGQLPNVPKVVAAGGILYNKYGWNAMLLDKYIGKEYGDFNNQHPVNAFSQVNATLGYTLNPQGDEFGGWLQQAKINLQVNNLLDKKCYTSWQGTANGQDLYWTLPGRSYFVTLSAHI